MARDLPKSAARRCRKSGEVDIEPGRFGSTNAGALMVERTIALRKAEHRHRTDNVSSTRNSQVRTGANCRESRPSINRRGSESPVARDPGAIEHVASGAHLGSKTGRALAAR